MEDNGSLGEKQASFKAVYSVINHNFAVDDRIVRLHFNMRKKLFCAFVDCKKAVDTVDCTFLWQKLHANDVGLKFIHVLYQDAKSKISYNGKF